MRSYVPDWWSLLLLTAATFRIYRLIAEDTILDGPRKHLLNLVGWDPDVDDTPPEGYREKIGLFITCPWCLGFWLSLGFWTAWWYEPHWTLVVCVPLTISSLVGLVAKLDQ